MNIIDALQGTSEWLAARAGCFTASEAPAMMGASKYQTRSDLLKQKATGLTPDVDAGTQRLFDRGHAAEEAARQIVEGFIGESLYPVTGWIEVDGLRLLASFDGLTAMDDIAWETKLWNATLADAVRAGQLDPHYYWQLEQQLLVSGAEKVYFTTSDGTPENTVGMWYESLPERRAALIAGWKQFALDLAAYEHVEAIPAAVAEPQMALPAVFIQVNGSIALTDNLTVFGNALTAYVERINKKPETDNDFATLEATVKTLKNAEEALDAAENSALGQAASIDTMRRAVALYRAMARDNRLMIDKIVKAEKDNRRADIIRCAQDVMMKHIDKLNERVGGYMPRAIAPFAEAIKGLKSIDSMRDKIAGALAQAKIEANELADRIQINLSTLEANAEFKSLFPDVAQIITKPNGDFMDTVNARIAAHKAAEAAKAEAAKKAEESRIAAAVEAERKAGEARAAAAVEAERQAEAKRVADAAAAADQRGKADEARPASPQAEALYETASASTPPIQIDHEGKRAVLVEAGDDVRAYLNTICLSDKEFGRLRAVLMGYEQFKAARALKAAA
jgi:putative phage-type endonuclease